MTQLAALNVKITGDSSDLQSDLTKAEAGVKKVGAAATVAQTKTTGFTGRLSKLGNVSGSTRAKIQNTSFQLQDIAVQLQGGTRASTVFAQQLPQLLGGFGALGAVLGVVAGVGIPALAFAFAGLENKSVSLEESVDNLKDALDKYAQASENAQMTTKELNEKFGAGAEGLKSTYELLQQIAANEAQRAIDGVAQSLSDLLGTAGAGESRANLADFFDVNIFLAFTDAQRDARKQARLLTAEFERNQDALENAEGSLDDQIAATQRLLTSAQSLANLKDGISETEEDLIKQLAEALAMMQEQKASLEGGRDAARELADEMAFIASLSPEVQARMVVAGVEAGNIPPQALTDLPMSDADKAMEKILERRRKLARQEDSEKNGSKSNPLIGELEQLEQSLMTQEEMQIASFDRQQETLRSALEQKLLTKQQFDALTEDSQAKHNDAMEKLDRQKQQASLQGYAGMFGDLASLMQSNNKTLFRIGQASAIAEAVINGYSAAVAAWEKGMKIGGPPVASAFAGASLIKTGSLISSIASASPTGSGAGASGGGGAGAAIGAAGQASRPMEAHISGFDPNSLFTGASITSLFDALQDEAGDRGLSVSFA